MVGRLLSETVLCDLSSLLPSLLSFSLSWDSANMFLEQVLYARCFHILPSCDVCSISMSEVLPSPYTWPALNFTAERDAEMGLKPRESGSSPRTLLLMCGFFPSCAQYGNSEKGSLLWFRSPPPTFSPLR